MSKLSPKRVAQLYHKIIVLADILADTINELHNESDPVGAAFKNSLEITQAHCEDLVGKGFKVTPETGGYLNDIAVKIDTVLRKNYIEIKK